MIHKQDIFSLNYYNYKNAFTGSYQGMNYRIIKAEEDSKEVLRVWIWRGIYCFDKTPKEECLTCDFSFSEEGLEEVVTWLNKNYQNRN